MDRRILTAVLAGAGVLVVALAFVGWPASTYRDFDFIPFWIAGHMLLGGGDPYDASAFRDAFLQAGSQGHAFGGPFAYPLPAAVLSVPFALLPFDLAAPAWFVAQVALAGIALSLLARQLFGDSARRDLPVLIALLAAMPATLLTLDIGNVGGFLLAIAAGALALLLAGRPALAGAVLGVAVFKPHVFILLVPFLLLRSPDRLRIAAGGLASSSALLALAFIARPGWFPEWVNAAGSLGAIDVAHANAWGPFPEEARWLGWLLAGALVAAYAAWWRWRDPPLPEHYAAALALSLAVTPYVWSHYHMVLAVPAMVVMSAAPSRGPVRAMVLGALALTLVVIPWWLYLDTYRSGAEPFGVIGPIAMFALIIAVGVRRRNASVSRATAMDVPLASAIVSSTRPSD